MTRRIFLLMAIPTMATGCVGLGKQVHTPSRRKDVYSEQLEEEDRGHSGLNDREILHGSSERHRAFHRRRRKARELRLKRARDRRREAARDRRRRLEAARDRRRRRRN